MPDEILNLKSELEVARVATNAGCKQSIPDARRQTNLFYERIPLSENNTSLDWERAVVDERIGFLESRIVAERLTYRALIEAQDRRIATLEGTLGCKECGGTGLRNPNGFAVYVKDKSCPTCSPIRIEVRSRRSGQ